MKRVIDGVTRIGLGMVNSYLLETPEALVLIDTGFPKSADKILAAMKQLGHEPDALAHIVLTHALRHRMHRTNAPVGVLDDRRVHAMHPNLRAGRPHQRGRATDIVRMINTKTETVSAICPAIAPL
jgi:Metallo-beta-lactamase superfamily